MTDLEEAMLRLREAIDILEHPDYLGCSMEAGERIEDALAKLENMEKNKAPCSTCEYGRWSVNCANPYISTSPNKIMCFGSIPKNKYYRARKPSAEEPRYHLKHVVDFEPPAEEPEKEGEQMDPFEEMARNYIEGTGGLFDLYRYELAEPKCIPKEVEGARWIIACLVHPHNWEDLKALVKQSEMRDDSPRILDRVAACPVCNPEPKEGES